MGYTVDLEHDRLACKTKDAAREAAALVNANAWMQHHVLVSMKASSSPERDDAWHLVLDNFDGCYWNEPSARRVWLALVPFMADGATLDFRHEEGDRFRIRWDGGRAFEEYPKEIIRALECEITSALLEE